MINHLFKMKRELTKKEKMVLLDLAESVVSIPEGARVGRWTREDRVAVVFSVLCSLVRNKK